uniref:SnoaL-like domain-containing protein n=1 Tax=Arundo donax TaxID=35708 RepID=A0A0A8YDB8_ARUDO
MTSTLTSSMSFQSPRFVKLQSGPQQHQPPPRLETSGTRQRKPGFPLKPIHAAAPGSNATGGLNKGNRRGTSSPLSDVIQEFYSSLNDKDSKQLQNLIAPDCVIQDTAYYKPLDTKSTRTYFKRLTEAMGENVKFAIDEVCQGAESTVAVMWHLEWNGNIIPFTKGCSFCMFSGNGAALLIRKIHIFDESPLKPGKWALEILNVVTHLLDMFPNIAEGFLKDPEAVVQPFVKLYKFYVKPFILPFLAYYTHFWTYVAQGLTMVLHIIYNLFKRLM